MTGTIDPPCGVPAHRMGRWEDVVLGIWWCPECGEEIWVTEGVDDEREPDRASPSTEAGVRAQAEGETARGGAARWGREVSGVSGGASERGSAEGASGDRASGDGFGWRDRPGGQRLWRLIWEEFGRAAQ